MNTRFTVIETSITDLTVLERRPLGDDRGFLERLFCRDELSHVLGGKAIAQVNRTLTAKAGTVRGLHFQYPPHAETKFVCCLRGEVFDVAVDLRQRSPTFLSWHSQLLSAENHRTLVVPEGFAHGFQTLVDDCEMLYLHTAAYMEDAEGGLNATDPILAIDWPKTITEQSSRDQRHPMLSDNFRGLEP